MFQCTYGVTVQSQVQTQECSLPVSKYEYPHRDALLTALLPGLVKNFSSQEEVITIAATRFSFFLQKGELTLGRPITIYITKFEINLVQLCPNWLTSYKTILLKGVHNRIMINNLFLHFLHCEQCRGITYLAQLSVFQNLIRKH